MLGAEWARRPLPAGERTRSGPVEVGLKTRSTHVHRLRPPFSTIGAAWRARAVKGPSAPGSIYDSPGTGVGQWIVDTDVTSWRRARKAGATLRPSSWWWQSPMLWGTPRDRTNLERAMSMTDEMVLSSMNKTDRAWMEGATVRGRTFNVVGRFHHSQCTWDQVLVCTKPGSRPRFAFVKRYADGKPRVGKHLVVRLGTVTRALQQRWIVPGSHSATRIEHLEKDVNG